MNEKWDDKTAEIGYVAHKKLDAEIGYVAHKKLDVQSRRRWVNNSNFKTVFKEFSFMNKYGKCYLCKKNMACLKHPK